MATELTELEEEERKTAYIELFFDLVFVYAITQVTTLILSDTSPGGFARSLLVLAIVWWAWSGYAWMTDSVDIDDLATTVSLLAAAAATFVVAVAIPGAYAGDGLWFGIGNLAVTCFLLVLYTRGAKHDPELLRSVLRLTPFFLLGPAVVLVGCLLDSTPRTVAFAVSVVINFVGALDAGGRTWRVSASHFAERHALFVIIALGESIVAIGVGAADGHRDASLLLSILIAFAGSAVLWWGYFAWTAGAVERTLRRIRDPAARGRMARDLGTFVHFPIIAGIVLFAVAAKKAVAHGGDPLSGAGRFALAAGIALYLLAMAAGRYRVIRAIAWERVGAAAAVAALAVLLADAPATALIALAAVIVAGALAVESRRLEALRAPD